MSDNRKNSILSTYLTQLLFKPAQTKPISRPKTKSSSLIWLTQAILFFIILTNAVNCGVACLHAKILNISLCLMSLLIYKFGQFTSLKAKTRCNAFISIYNILMFNFGQVSSPLSWFEAQLFPILSFSLTRSRGWFLFHTISQIIYSHKILDVELEKGFSTFAFEDFIFEIKYFSGLLLLLNFIIVLIICKSFEKVNTKTVISDQESRLFQKQKDFLLCFSHEFRNHAHSIVGNIRLAGLEQLSEKTRHLLLRAEVSGEFLLQYVNNILDAGKLDVNELEINLAPTRIYDVIERVWRVSSELMRMKEITGSIKISSKVPSLLLLDSYRINQVFLNLIHNAIRFTEKGSISIFVDWLSHEDTVTKSCFEPVPFNETNEYDEGLFEKRQAFSVFDDELLTLNYTRKNISARRSISSESPRRNNGVLKVTITDTGCGIKQEDLANLWSIFYKPTDASSIGRKNGQGLGLFVTKKLCQSMGGDIDAFSKAGKGSSFIFCIPTQIAVNKTEEEKNTEVLASVIRNKGLKGMIVDDVHFNNLILKNFLEKLGIEVSHIAENGLEACNNYITEARNRKGIDIITMDIDMPLMDGKVAAQKIREYEVTHGLKPSIIIMISGECSESNIKECLDQKGKIRANGFLKKPASMEELTRMIESEIVK